GAARRAPRPRLPRRRAARDRARGGVLMAIEAGGMPLAERLRALLARRARGEEAAELATFARLLFARGGGYAEELAPEEAAALVASAFRFFSAPGPELRVTDDFAAMVARAQAVAAELDGLGRSRSAQLATEATAVADFLRWLVDGAFVFLGYREYGLTTLGAAAMLQLRAGSGLGILRREERSAFREARRLDELPAWVRARLSPGRLLTVAKTIAEAPVHRRAHMDD